MVETIMVEDALEIKDCVFIDVRTPKEFEEYHIKDAINVPLFSNSERHEIGCLYKQVSQEKAIQFGMDMFLSRVDSYLKEIKGIKKDLIVYCWRGGMRSRAIAELFNTKGYRVWQLDGGIKAYRNYILKKLNEFNYDFEFYVLCGLTGSGKTKVLKNFENSPRVSLHDFDLLSHLRYLRKLGKLKKIKIIGVPPTISEKEALEQISAILRAS